MVADQFFCLCCLVFVIITCAYFFIFLIHRRNFHFSNDIHAPTLAWAIAHNYGAVWGMEWCPTGGFDNSSTPCRLGILALATSSGCIAVYSMPRLDCGGETRSAF